jgi:hypothetical protein
MLNIFSDIFNSIFEDNPLAAGTSGEVKPNEKKEEKKERKPGAVMASFTYEKKPSKVYNSDDSKKIEKQLNKKGYIEINPISKRFTDDDVDDKNKKLSLNEYDGKNTVEIDSTAIAGPIRYNEETGEVWLRFKGKNGKPSGKWYHYVSMDRNQFESFMKSSSKGRYVAKQMKYKNHDPAYPIT